MLYKSTCQNHMNGNNKSCYQNAAKAHNVLEYAKSCYDYMKGYQHASLLMKEVMSWIMQGILIMRSHVMFYCLNLKG